MKHKELLHMIDEAREGNDRPFNNFFNQLYASCKTQLLKNYANSEEEVLEAFVVSMSKFWQRFVVEKKPLPNRNIKGYIVNMTKYYLIDEQRRKSKNKIFPLAPETAGGVDYDKTEEDFWREQAMEDKYLEALKIAIFKLNTGCRKLFHLVLKGIEKPKDLYIPLDYKNPRTVGTVKSKCIKRLKIEILKELDRLI